MSRSDRVIGRLLDSCGRASLRETSRRITFRSARKLASETFRGRSLTLLRRGPGKEPIQAAPIRLLSAARAGFCLVPQSASFPVPRPEGIRLLVVDESASFPVPRSEEIRLLVSDQSALSRFLGRKEFGSWWPISRVLSRFLGGGNSAPNVRSVGSFPGSSAEGIRLLVADQSGPFPVPRRREFGS